MDRPKETVRETLLRIYKGLSYPTLNESDQKVVSAANASTAFGEFSPSGVDKMLDSQHLDGANATVMYDLGMGLGRLIIQAFLSYPNLQKVVGVELCPSRAGIAFSALRELAKTESYRFEQNSDGTRIRVIDRASEEKEEKEEKLQEEKRKADQPKWTKELPSTTRYLELRNCDLFLAKDALEDAQIVVLETAFPGHMYQKVCEFTSQLPKKTRMMTYTSLENFHCGGPMYYPYSSYSPTATVGSTATRVDMPWDTLTTDSWCEASFGANFFFYRHK